MDKTVTAAAETEEAVSRFNTAWGAHDLAGALALITDDCVFESTTPPDGERYVIPTLANGSDDIMASASAILAKLNAVPFEQIGQNLNGTLKAVNDIANGS